MSTLTEEEKNRAWNIAEVDELHQTLCDALAGWRYIRETHGDLYGVGWDRVERRLDAQITASAERIKQAAREAVRAASGMQGMEAPRVLNALEVLERMDYRPGDRVLVENFLSVLWRHGMWVIESPLTAIAAATSPNEGGKE
jgi:hypothetical protein